MASAETEVLASTFDRTAEAFETVAIKPKKTNISVRLFTLAWAPYWKDPSGKSVPAWE